MTSNSWGSYSYDANGNTLSDAQGRSFTWDFENRLTQAIVSGTNGGTTTFKYDPFGRRIQKSGPLGTTNYLYDGDDLIEEADGTGSALAKYAMGDDIDEPLSELRSGTTSYYEQDGIDAVTSLTNSAGAVSNSYTFDSFGKLTASTGTLTNPFRYTGREFDSETGLYFDRARYYDEATGRFINEDPVAFQAGTNFYTYAVNNPIRFRDPSGKNPGVIALPIAGGICFGSGVCEAIIVGGAVVGVTAALGYYIYKDIHNSDNADTQSEDNSTSCKKDPFRGLRIQLEEHQKKLAAYAGNPYAYDNRNILGRGYDDPIIAGRVKHLVEEILELAKQLEECERANGIR